MPTLTWPTLAPERESTTISPAVPADDAILHLDPIAPLTGRDDDEDDPDDDEDEDEDEQDEEFFDDDDDDDDDDDEAYFDDGDEKE